MNIHTPATHRFPIGTQYMQRYGKGKADFRICTVSDHMTLTNSKGEVVRRYYQAQHTFAGQLLTDPDVADTTIARNLLEDPT